ncbi:MAG TPA: hypothetical protein VEO94_08930, partial [Candidatus Dormibacteraeota bacterium]|nr:hypothetical protein [Candidatus Dormibacteraeota bacterium]
MRSVSLGIGPSAVPIEPGMANARGRRGLAEIRSRTGTGLLDGPHRHRDRVSAAEAEGGDPALGAAIR